MEETNVLKRNDDESSEAILNYYFVIDWQDQLNRVSLKTHQKLGGVSKGMSSQ